MTSYNDESFDIFEEGQRIEILKLEKEPWYIHDSGQKDLRERAVLAQAITHLHRANEDHPVFAQKLKEGNKGQTPDFIVFSRSRKKWGYIEITDALPSTYKSPKKDNCIESTKAKLHLIGLRDMPLAEIPRLLTPVRDQIIKKAKHHYPADTMLIIYLRCIAQKDDIYHSYIEDNFDRIVRNENERSKFEGLDHFRKILILSPSFKKYCFLKK